MTSADEGSLLKELRNLAGSLFITGLSVNYYASFWNGWDGFVDDMAK